MRYELGHEQSTGNGVDDVLVKWRDWELTHVVPNSVGGGNYHLFFRRELSEESAEIENGALRAELLSAIPTVCSDRHGAEFPDCDECQQYYPFAVELEKERRRIEAGQS